jgi:sec-independent protein translocase protein TatA
MGELSVWHLLLVLGIVLIFFGPSRLPGLGNSLGKAIRGFKSGIKGVGDDEDKTVETAKEILPEPEKDPIKGNDKSKTNHS